MSWNWNSHGLPFLPGNTFRDVTKSAYHVPQTLTYKNGFAVARRPTVGIGQDPLLSEDLLQQEIREWSAEAPIVTHGCFEPSIAEDFIPAHVALDKKVLCFSAYFLESVLFSSKENYCVRPVIIYYYLEDDSMCIVEPKVENSGIPQGIRIRRQRLPKNECGEHYLWKDLNIGMDLEVYAVKYHITQCDPFTKEFMEKEGITLNEPEPMPVDPYHNRRENPPASVPKPSKHDSLHQFLTMDRKVLHFFAVWDDTDSLFGERRPVTIQYYLVDDTVEINEVYKRNSGRFPFPVLMHRQKPPKKVKPSNIKTFPSCVLEVSAAEVDEYYSPKDFRVGEAITLLGRRFLLHDCDAFTKEYYQTNYPDLEMKPYELPKEIDPLKERIKDVPPYNGYGSPEDSLQHCFALVPDPPRKDVKKMLANDQKVLRYSARLESQNAGDEDRRFILCYFLSDDTICIYEKNIHNSGIIGGKYLRRNRIHKPGSTVDNPNFYSPADFAIGATIEVFSHRFVLTGADNYVLKCLQVNAAHYPLQTLESLRQCAETANNQEAEPNGPHFAEPVLVCCEPELPQKTTACL